MSFQLVARLSATSLAVGLLLVGCGGGNDTSNAAPLVEGRVIDGYIRGALVFWDCNKNGVKDTEEISTLSGVQGSYQIIDIGTKDCPLLAYVGPTAVDEDKPLQLGSAYTLQAVQGRPGLITPFTTLVAGKVASSGLTVEQANTAVAAMFGLNQDLLVDYKATSSAPLNAAAQASVEVLKTTQDMGHGLLTDSVRQTLDVVAQRYSDSRLRAAIAKGVVPYVESFKSLSDHMAQRATGNDANRLVRRVSYSNAAQNDELKAIVAAVNAQSGTRFGYPAWSAFSTEQLRGFARTINRLNATQSSAPYSAKLQAIQQRRATLFAEASARMNKEVGYDGVLAGAWDFFSNDPGASLDFGMSALAISGDIATDVLTLAMPRPKVGRPTNLTQYKKKLAGQLEVYGTVVSAGDCLVKVNKLETSDDLAAALVDVVTSCGVFMTDQLKQVSSTLHTGKLTDGLSAALSASGGVYGVVKEEDRVLVALKMSATTFNLIHDLLALFANDPVTSKVLSAADLGLQFLNARVAAMELERAANEKLDDTLRVAMAKYDEEVAKAWRSYFISFMEIYGDYYFEVKDSSQCATGTVLSDDGVCRPTFNITTPLYEQLYTSHSGEQCYDKRIGTAKSAGVYTFSNTTYCLRGGQGPLHVGGRWVDATGVDNERYLDSQGNLYPFSSVEIKDTGNNTYTAGYGGSTIWNLTLTQKSAGVYSQSVKSVADSYSVYFDPNSYIYQNSETLPLLIAKYNAGTPYTGYLSSGGDIGFLFASSPAATEGLIYYFRVDDPNRHNSNRVIVDTGTWSKKSFGSNTQIIELDEKSTMLNDGDAYMRKIYYKNSSESGVRDGNKWVAGQADTIEMFDRKTFDAMLARDGLPATPN